MLYRFNTTTSRWQYFSDRGKARWRERSENVTPTPTENDRLTILPSYDMVTGRYVEPVYRLSPPGSIPHWQVSGDLIDWEPSEDFGSYCSRTLIEAFGHIVLDHVDQYKDAGRRLARANELASIVVQPVSESVSQEQEKVRDWEPESPEEMANDLGSVNAGANHGPNRRQGIEVVEVPVQPTLERGDVVTLRKLIPGVMQSLGFNTALIETPEGDLTIFEAMSLVGAAESAMTVLSDDPQCRLAVKKLDALLRLRLSDELERMAIMWSEPK